MAGSKKLTGKSCCARHGHPELAVVKGYTVCPGCAAETPEDLLEELELFETTRAGHHGTTEELKNRLDNQIYEYHKELGLPTKH